MKNTIRDFIRFINEKRIVEVLFFVVILIYGKHAFTLNANIDTEDFLTASNGNINGWLITGRFGTYFTCKFLGLLNYNPYFAGVLFIIFLVLSTILWIFNFYVYSGKNKKYPYMLFGLIYVTVHLWCYIFYFSMVQLEVIIGICCEACVVFLVFDVCFGKSNRITKYLKMIASVILFIWGVGIYEANLVIYLVGCSITFFLYYREQLENDSAEIKEMCKKLLYIILHFIISYGIYSVIVRAFSSGDNYVNSKIKWSVNTIANNIREIFSFIYNVFFEQGNTQSFFMLIVIILLFLDAIVIGFNKKYSWKNIIFYYVILFGIMLVPFSLSFYIGGELLKRTQFPFVLFIAFSAMYAITWLGEASEKYKTKVIVILTVIISIFIYKEISINLRLWYTDDLCNKQNQIVAENITEEISRLGLGEIPPQSVVILGRKQVNLNAVCLKDDMFGVSNFSWDYTNPTGSTKRSLEYIHAITGISYSEGNEEERRNAIEKGRTMPCYPTPGYVMYDEAANIILVKLSEYE